MGRPTRSDRCSRAQVPGSRSFQVNDFRFSLRVFAPITLRNRPSNPNETSFLGQLRLELGDAGFEGFDAGDEVGVGRAGFGRRGMMCPSRYSSCRQQPRSPHSGSASESSRPSESKTGSRPAASSSWVSRSRGSTTGASISARSGTTCCSLRPALVASSK